MFSGCLSVRPKPEITSFHLYMGPVVSPSNRDRFSVGIGFRALPGERMERMAWNYADVS